VQPDHERWGQIEVIAPLCSKPSGFAEITHPFHPLFRQQFFVLKFRTVRGMDCVILKGSSSGTFSVPRDWTSLRRNDRYQDAGAAPRILHLESLLELSKLVTAVLKSISKP
jgi:hypothetical protein